MTLQDGEEEKEAQVEHHERRRRTRYKYIIAEVQNVTGIGHAKSLDDAEMLAEGELVKL
eukprot:CAMPEP_0171016752 /NCGR_PEP_ID=MMETSP0736-20130129/26968_1 /TAXON_ID=186038 /ORGANISM="Fragilariopsis kerguelensis, Strain L26-C5" /LENGTH=58 /DNA_ID=CAMNT_0011452345 /DNA_START=766 /DNA_END=942 /DNA_ORIENTATION=+